RPSRTVCREVDRPDGVIPKKGCLGESGSSEWDQPQEEHAREGGADPLAAGKVCQRDRLLYRGRAHHVISLQEIPADGLPDRSHLRMEGPRIQTLHLIHTRPEWA